MAAQIEGQESPLECQKHRFVVNCEPANIFKGILEMQKSAENGKRFAKSGG